MNNSVTKTTFSNGLSVLLKEIHTTPLISSWLWYRVGSRDETPGLTGISHWVEHMQFKGTPKFPPQVLDRAISREGGMWNAFTYLDWTTFLETLPAQKIDLAFNLEADRMTNSLYDPKEVASERTVIISEREGSENEPAFRLAEAIQKASFHSHPYGHEVIGEKSDLNTITRDDLFDHYRSYYIPNNAVLSVAGDFHTPELLALIKDTFEPIPAGTLPAHPNLVESPPSSEQRIDLTGPGDTTYLKISYPFPSATNPDLFPFMVLDSLLSGPDNPSVFSGGGISNKTSRLYRALVEKELAVGVSGGGQVTIDPFLYGTMIVVHPNASPQAALSAFDEQILQLQSTLTPEAEIQRAIKQARAIFAYDTENITNQAAWLGFSEMFADVSWFDSYLDQLKTVTASDIQRIAQKYLIPTQRFVGTFQPDGRTS